MGVFIVQEEWETILEVDCLVIFGVIEMDRKWGLVEFLVNVIPLVWVRLEGDGC